MQGEKYFAKEDADRQEYVHEDPCEVVVFKRYLITLWRIAHETHHLAEHSSLQILIGKLLS